MSQPDQRQLLNASDTVDVTCEHLEQPTTEPAVAPALAGAPQIPGYLITGEIARGGMGQVWSAIDFELDREVAIKTLLSGTHAQRFTTEAKITARLPHPGIPPVHRLGELSDGTYYLAMKLIRGRTLAALLAERESPQDELSRFMQVFEQICQAVGFAHARGIIHRDLKPLNVMVGEFGEVQVMDWGLAKQSGLVPRVHAQPLASSDECDLDLTAAGAIMGTPSYMAPEQARGDAVDPRADVFALGSILAAILTGQPAFVGKTGHETIARAAAADLADVLSRLDQCGADRELIDLARHCLSPNREARPTDANAVAAAVTAYRQGVEARLRQTETERAQALVREAEQQKRRRQFVVATAAVLVTLTIGLAASLWQMRRAVTAEKSASMERDAKGKALEAETAARLAETAAREDATNKRNIAEKRLAQIEKGVDLFAGMLSGIDPRAEEHGGQPIYDQLRERAEKAAVQLDAEAVGDALAVARLQTALGNTLRGLGSYNKAVEVLAKARAIRERELVADHTDTLTTLHDLAAACLAAGQLQQAIQLYAQIRNALIQKLGAEHTDTLTALHNLALAYQRAGQLREAIQILEQVRDGKVQKLGDDHLDTLGTLHTLAGVYRDAGQLRKAIQIFEQVRDAKVQKLGPDHVSTLATLNNLALTYYAAGQLREAIQIFEQVRDAEVQKLGANHPSTLTTLANLATAYRVAGQLREAIQLFEQVRDARVMKLGPDHPDTLATLNNLALAYMANGQLREAIRLFEQVRDAFVHKLGADHPSTLTSLSNLAMAYQAAKQLPEAIQLYEQVHSAFVHKLGADHTTTVSLLNNLATAYKANGQLREAIRLYEQVRDAFVHKLGADHPSTLTTLHNLASAHQASGQLPEAVPLFEQAATGIARRRFQHEHAGPIIGSTIAVYERTGQLDRAEGWRRKWLAHVRDEVGATSLAYTGELAGLGLNLLNQKKWAEAEASLKECLSLREKTQADLWSIFNTKSMLGGALSGQKKFAEAELLLVEGYEGMKAREDKIPAPAKVWLTEALQRLVDLYTAWEKPEEVAKWKAALDAATPPPSKQ